MSRLHLFRGGTQTAMSGLERAYDVAGIAASYDPALHEAPLVLGHPTHDAPAYGWVASLSAQGADLFGEPSQIDPAFAEAVEKGRYKKLSVSLYLESSPAHPVRVAGGTPTAPYLRHVGFLGAMAPAVKGLAPVEFAEDEEGVATVEFSEADFADAPTWAVRALVGLLRRVRDYVSGRDGEDVAEGVVPSRELDATLEALAYQEGRESGVEEGRSIGASALASPAFGDGTSPVEPDAPLTDIDISTPPDMTPEETAAREAAFAERERKLAEREAVLADQAAAATRADNAAFCEALAADGARILPADVPAVAAVLDALAGVAPEGQTVSFGEGDEAEQLDPAAALRRVLEGLPERVDFSERSGAEVSGDGSCVAIADFAGAPGFEVDPGQLALHRKAKRYQADHAGTSYEAAVRAVS